MLCIPPSFLCGGQKYSPHYATVTNAFRWVPEVFPPSFVAILAGGLRKSGWSLGRRNIRQRKRNLELLKRSCNLLQIGSLFGHKIKYTTLTVRATPGSRPTMGNVIRRPDWFRAYYNIHYISQQLTFAAKSLRRLSRDVVMSAMASQITSLTIVYSTVYSGADQRKHQSSASPAFARRIPRWPVNSPQKGPVTRKMCPFNDIIIDQVQSVREGQTRALAFTALINLPAKKNLDFNAFVRYLAENLMKEMPHKISWSYIERDVLHLGIKCDLRTCEIIFANVLMTWVFLCQNIFPKATKSQCYHQALLHKIDCKVTG